MKRSEAIDQLREMDAKYSCYVYCKNELAVVLGEQGQKLNRTLSSLVSAKALVRAARGVYVFAYSSHLGEGTLHQVAKRLRSGELVWESLESALSRWNVISQIPVDRVTFMTTGREGEFRTAYGVIEFTHCKLSWSRILPNLIARDDGLTPLASKQWAYRDLKAVGRNLDLVDMEGVTSDEPNCSVPWPSARNHASVLAPWLDMDPNASLGGDPVAFLLAMAPDAGQVGLLSDNWILSNS